jgi:hypothetical protein
LRMSGPYLVLTNRKESLRLIVPGGPDSSFVNHQE